MYKILTTFFISFTVMAIIITLSVILIDSSSILLSVLLLEIVIYLVFLVFIQGVFIGQRQVYTTKKMLKHVKAITLKPQAFNHYLMKLKSDFHMQKLSEHATLYTKNQAESLFHFKKKTYFSIIHLNKPLKLNDILALHENNISNKNHRIRIFLTMLQSSEPLENFLHTIMYDHTTKPTQYHIPIFISDSYIHTFDESNYLAHPELTSIITYINAHIKKT